LMIRCFKQRCNEVASSVTLRTAADEWARRQLLRMNRAPGFPRLRPDGQGPEGGQPGRPARTFND
ncbi:hypothetical protein P9204_15725, partial [Geobacillus stearothermophilus]|nr:hypothetical protein [Geobacillus stearothermophilus]